MRNGVLAIEADGSIALINDIAYRILGLRPDPNDVGRPYPEVLDKAPDVVQMLASAFDLSYLPNRAELRLRHSGKVIGYTLSRITDEHERVTGAVLFFKDLTRVEQLEERERLRDRLAALGEMAAAIAHEVKNPLAGIQVMAGLLKRRVPDSADAQSILTDIINEAKMANTIVVDVLEFVRPLNLQVEEVSIETVLVDAIAKYESQVAGSEVEVTTTIDETLPFIRGDDTMLRQLFTNLLVNAFEALEGRGHVTIAATFAPNEDELVAAGEPPADVGSVTVVVDDDGPGIPADVTEKIFSPFFTTKPRGSGLGLAIVHKIVHAHDGRIDVGAPPGGGTRFEITLPVTGDLVAD